MDLIFQKIVIFLKILKNHLSVKYYFKKRLPSGQYFKSFLKGATL